MFTGRISCVDSWPVKNPTRFNTLLRLPASDEYVTPATVEVQSAHSIGKEGETVTVTCEVGGRYRSYQVTDKLTGDQRTVRTADNILTVL
jgi:hypothetical protein